MQSRLLVMLQIVAQLPVVACGFRCPEGRDCDGEILCPNNRLEIRPNDLGVITQTGWTCDGAVATTGFCQLTLPKVAWSDAVCLRSRVRAARSGVDGGGVLAVYFEFDSDGGDVVSVSAQLESLSSETDQPSRIWTTADGWIAFDATGRAPSDRFAAHFGLVLGDDLGSMAGVFDTDPGCDPVQPLCLDGYGCYFHTGYSPDPVCLPAGPHQLGEWCIQSEQCEPGLACAGTIAAPFDTSENRGKCSPICDLEADDCGPSATCAEFEGAGYGACVPTE